MAKAAMAIAPCACGGGVPPSFMTAVAPGQAALVLGEPGQGAGAAHAGGALPRHEREEGVFEAGAALACLPPQVVPACPRR